jgi:hypothetical protein
VRDVCRRAEIEKAEERGYPLVGATMTSRPASRHLASCSASASGRLLVASPCARSNPEPDTNATSTLMRRRNSTVQPSAGDAALERALDPGAILNPGVLL